MAKQRLTAEQRRADADILIIALTTAAFFISYAAMRSRILAFVKDSDVSIAPRLLFLAALQFGVAGLGITIVCLLRKERFTQFGLTGGNFFRAAAGTALCFAPLICFILASGRYSGYRPFGSIMITKEVLARGLPFSIPGMALILIVWGFFEGFSYVVVCEKINTRYPSGNQWLDYGAAACAFFCLLFHPFSLSFWGAAEMIAVFAAIYGMLIVKKKTGNAWGCVLAFVFIWNAI